MKQKKRTYRPFQDFILEQIQDPKDAALYLTIAAQDEDQNVFLTALRNVILVHGKSIEMD